MAGLSFAAIDVETANSSRGSICAVGVTVVREGRRLATHSWLCRPPAALNFFSPHNIRVHGITAAMVEDRPPFGAHWNEIVQAVDGLPLVAHNAGFDSSAIREACTQSGIIAPDWDFSCSLAMSRRHLDLESYRLPSVADALGIELLTHHDAAADAAASAEIVLALAAQTGARSLGELERTGYLRPPRRRETPRSPRADRPVRNYSFPREELVMPEVSGTDPAHALYGHTIVFTGNLASLTRQQAWDAIAACGATPARNVTRRTTALVIGDSFVGDDPAAFTTTKARRVHQLRNRGQHIDVIDEQRLLVLLERDAGGASDAWVFTHAYPARQPDSVDLDRYGPTG
ncbi:exonuclease domain-containing protein [Nocardia jejuensis]|uniref:exonuclease domain-containing protein n=1 Tax=Nocardia jejuensis TaxID=328049 RepID=UPI0014717687|nr:exonuclease domain-containing protein [Nocardia jejuensis]